MFIKNIFSIPIDVIAPLAHQEIQSLLLFAFYPNIEEICQHAGVHFIFKLREPFRFVLALGAIHGTFVSPGWLPVCPHAGDRGNIISLPSTKGYCRFSGHNLIPMGFNIS